MFTSLHIKLHVESAIFVVALVSVDNECALVFFVIDFLVLSHKRINHQLKVALLGVNVDFGSDFLRFFQELASSFIKVH